MPSRVIRGEINCSRSLARVSLLADLTFRALIVSVDDFGRCEADPLMLKAELFPRRPDVHPEHIAVWVEELCAEGCVRRYEVDGVAYLELPSWEKHRSNQKRGNSSKFPDPPKASLDPRESPRIPGETLGSPKPPGNPHPSDVLRLTSDECFLASGECRIEEPPAAEPPAHTPELFEEPESVTIGHPLLRMLGSYAGSPEEKRLWLEHELPLMKIEAESTGKPLKSFVIRWYRTYADKSPPRRWEREAELAGARAHADRIRREMEAEGMEVEH